MINRRVRMENAPDWYDTPLDQLDFEWSKEEKLEIERYCEKIHKNIAEEEMTPKQRYKATVEGKEKDRVFVYSLAQNVYGATVLDSHADAIRPIDVYRHPKLLVKSHLATTARFKLDALFPYTLSYTEDLWGAKSRLIDYGNPVTLGDMPIKTMADLEGIEVPDPRKHGLYPGYLWAIREWKKILVEYDLYDKLEFQASTCPDGISTAMLGMTGISGFMILARKDPELCKKCAELGNEFLIDYCQAVIDEGIHSMWICYGIGWMPVKGNEWTLDYHLKAGKAIGPQIPTVITASVPGDQPWVPLIMEKGLLGPGSYMGWSINWRLDVKKMLDNSREHNIYSSTGFSDEILLNGPISDIEDAVKERVEMGKPHTKFAMTVGAIDYWTPPAHVDAAVAAVKKYGKY